MVVVTVSLIMTGCGSITEKIGEESLERAIESQSGEDIEFDFDGDGGISIDTEEGSIRVGEDGSFIVEGEDGELFTGQSTDEGFTVEGEDGESTFKTVSQIPEEWPSSQVLPPAGLADVTSTVVTGDGQIFITVVGTAPQGGAAYLDAYGAGLQSAAHERTSYFEGEDFVQATYQGPTYAVSITAFDSNAASNVSVSLLPS